MALLYYVIEFEHVKYKLFYRFVFFFLFFSELNTTNEEDILLIYSRYCPGAVEWAKYLHKLYLELSKRKGKLRYDYGI